MRRVVKSISIPSLVLFFFIGGCSAPTSQISPTKTMNNASEQPIYDDPFDYCRAVGSVDSPDDRYVGPPMPDSIIKGLIQQGIIPTDSPPEFKINAVWRCMNGRVWVCHFGANLPCQEKADISETSTPKMEDFCKTNPATDIIPAYVTGRATVYEWKCNDGKPKVVRQVFHVDPRGYLSEFWHELSSK